MITDKVKATVEAKLQMGEPPADIAEELDLPVMLVEKWFEAMPKDKLVQLKANTLALTNAIEGAVQNSEENRKLLEAKIEEVALVLVNEVPSTAYRTDFVKAQTLKSLSQVLVNAHTLLNKDGKSASEGTATKILFEQFKRD